MSANTATEAGYLWGHNATIQTLVPAPGELAEREPHVPVRKTPSGIAWVQAPEERFKNRPGDPFAAHDIEIDGLRMAHADAIAGAEGRQRRAPEAAHFIRDECGVGLAEIVHRFMEEGEAS